MKLLIPLLLGCLLSSLTFFLGYSQSFANLISTQKYHNDADYFKVLEQLQQIPPGYTTIKPLSTAETKSLYTFFIRNRINPLGNSATFPCLDAATGKLYNPESMEFLLIYTGDFDNSKRKEYVIISSGGTAHIADYYFFLIKHGHYEALNFSKVLLDTFAKDMFHLYWWHAQPFIIQKNGLSYLRFMELSSGMNYDKKSLLVCTYLWKKNILKFIREDKDQGSTRHCELPCKNN